MKTISWFLIFIFTLSILTPINIPSPMVETDKHQDHNESNHVDATKINMLRTPFIKNIGQINSDEVKFYAKTFAGTVFVTNDDLTYHSVLKTTETHNGLSIKEKFVDGSIKPSGIEKSESIVNYFVGNKENWKTNIPTFQTVSLGNVWPSIDVTLKAYGNNIEKIFTIFPGGKVKDIKLKMDGITTLSLGENDQLVVNSELGMMSFTNPIAFQYKNLEKVYVDASYEIIDSQTYGFKIQNFDPQLPVIIDPLIASTFIGGTGMDFSNDLRRDSAGNVYIVGETLSSDFPTTTGAYDTSSNGNNDVFVSKLNSNLSTLMASTFIGGSDDDSGSSISLDSSGNVFVTGYTVSSIYPTTTGAYDTSFNGGTSDVFVSKLNSNLSTLMASTFIGGSDEDAPNEIKIDSSGNVYVTGHTSSSGYPTTTGAYDTSSNGGMDVFVSKLNSNLSTLMASTFIGGSNDDSGHSLSIRDPDVQITGYTSSSGYPTTTGAYDTSFNGGTSDVFVSKLDNALSSLSASTFIGGSSEDVGQDIEIDSTNVFVTGKAGTGYPTTTGAYDTSFNGGTSDVFVSKLDNALSSLSASTFIGGSSADVSIDMILDNTNNAYITGHTGSSDYPTTSGAFDTSHGGGGEVFVSKFSNALSSLSASTFIGASGDDVGNAIILDDAANVYVTGYTTSSGYPTTTGAYDTTFNSGTDDGFVTIINCELSSTGTCVTTLQSGGTVSITVGAGETATVTAPGNTISVTLPAGVSGTITFTDTTTGAATESTLEFLGSVVDITTTAVGTKTISFTFTQAQADAADITPSQAKIYEDINEDGSFQTNEALATTVTGSGPFTATASTDFQSKFAVGGVVRVNAIGAALGFIEKYSCDPDGFGSGISLKLYKISYDVAIENKLWAEARSTCGPMALQVVSDGKISSGGISADQPRLDEKIVRLEIQLLPDQKAFSIVLKDKRDYITKNFYISEPIYEKDYTKIQQWSSDVNYSSNISENKPKETEMRDSIPDWVRNNAKWWSDNSIEDSDFVRGIQFLIKEDIIHMSQATKDISSVKPQQIPTWIKSNAGWWADGLVSDGEFIQSTQWLITNGIIKID